MTRREGAKVYGEVVRLLGPFEEQLSEAERARLNYARKQVMR